MNAPTTQPALPASTGSASFASLDACEVCGRVSGCQAGSDGECWWPDCPQIRDGEPARSGRHCPLDRRDDDESPNADSTTPVG